MIMIIIIVIITFLCIGIPQNEKLQTKARDTQALKEGSSLILLVITIENSLARTLLCCGFLLAVLFFYLSIVGGSRSTTDAFAQNELQMRCK